MTPATDAKNLDRLRLRALALALLICLVATLAVAGEAGIPPAFSKAFMPDTIGPGSVSMLVFTIDNSESPIDPVGEMAFSDTLPSGVALAAPAFSSNSCGGTVTAPDGGSTISFTDGVLGAGQDCQIIVNVTASLPGEGPYTNVSGDLTSDAGNSGKATADLTVTDNLPGFSKSFAPSTVPFGGRSTLTFTIDNTTECGECASDIEDLSFEDDLPVGMVVADPANASTDCEHPLAPATLTAVPGTAFISLSANGGFNIPSLPGEESCTVVVDVIGGAVGSLGNVTSDLLVKIGQSEQSAGKAGAVLEVTGVENLLELAKEFTDDPVAPGGTVTLEFTVTNKSRDDSATGITFDDDLEATLGGLSPNLPPSPDPPCGAGSSLSFSLGVLTLADGNLPPTGSCNFSVELTVPAGTAPGTYSNTAGPVSGDVGGAPETGNVAGDLLFVVSFPALTKEFTDDPVGAGGTVTLEFTITNTNPSSAMSDITFGDELTAGSGDVGSPAGFLPFPVSVGLPPTPDPPCGLGSSLTIVSFGTGRSGLELNGGSLAAAGMAGDSCTFSVTVDIPEGFASGTYTNTTEEISATLDDVAGTPTVVGPPASDDIVIVGAPQLSKEFTDDPALPGGTVTLEFTLENVDPDNAASAIAFSDNLTTTLPGLTLTSELVNTCGGMVGGVGTDMFSYSGGSLAAGTGCTISLLLTLPGAPLPGAVFPNTTSVLTATVDGVMVEGPAASDDLVATGLLFTKEFTDDPVIAGRTATLVFTLDNTSGTQAAHDIMFTDDLAAALPGLTANLPSTPDPPCGVGSVLVGQFGNTVLGFSGGNVAAGGQCSFSVTVNVPPGTPDDTYSNITSSLSAIIDLPPPVSTAGTLVTLPPATADLVVQSDILDLTKEFTDDPVNPGDTVTLEFTLTNLSATETVTEIAFDDDLDAALSGLVATGATVNTCGGMSLLMFPSGLFEYRGGSLLPGASCSITLQVGVPAGPLPGDLFTNTTTGVTGRVGPCPPGLSAGGAGPAACEPNVFGAPASDDLEVDLLTFSKSFDGPTSATGTAILTFTIENLDSVNDAVGLAFSDDLDAVISGLVATGLPASDVCGAGSVLAGTSFVTLTGASVAAAGTCTFDVTVQVPAMASVGSFLNTTSVLSQAGVPAAEPATAFLDIEPPPGFSKAFTPDQVFAGQSSTLTFTIDNTASAVPASGLDFTDNLPAGLVVATPPSASTTCTGGTLTADAGAGVISYTGGSVAAGASCTVEAGVTSAVAGGYVNQSGELTSSSGNSGSAGDELTVEPLPTFDKEFAPDTIFVAEVSTLTFTIDNIASALAVSGLDFTDTLPAGVVVAAPPNASTTCTGGTLTADAGTGVVSYTGGSLAAGASCSVEADVTSAVDGVYVNVSGDLTSSAGNSGTASDTLTVLVLEADLELAKTDLYEPVMAGRYQLYQLTVTNHGPDPAESVEVVDALPAGVTLVLAEPTAACGEAAGIVTCALGDLAVGDSATVTIHVYVGLQELPAPLDNMATVSSETDDPESGNNDVMESTEVIPFADLAVLSDVDDNGFPEVAVPLEGSIEVLVKDVGSLGVVHQTKVFPAGWTLAGFARKPGINGALDDVAVMAVDLVSGAAEVRIVAGIDGSLLATAQLPDGFRPLAMTLIPDDGTKRALAVVAARRFSDGASRFFVFDADTGAELGTIGLGPTLWPIDLAAVANFGADARVELGILAVNSANGGKRILVKELDGTVLNVHNLPIELMPVALTRVANCCGLAAEELAVLGWDRDSDRVRGRAADADSEAVISDRIFAVQASPSAVGVIDNFGGATADELVALYRNAAGQAATRVRDVQDGGQLFAGAVGAATGSIPLGLAVSPDSYDTVADEVAVFSEDAVSGAKTVTLRDPGSGKTVRKVPIP
jgi:uncharacterized repeat protein (TIGR01451 family)